MARVSVKALTAFYGSEEGKVVAGQDFALNEGYARELEGKGMVKINGTAPDAAARPAPQVLGGGQASSLVEQASSPVEQPSIKMNEPPANKMKPLPVTKAKD